MLPKKLIFISLLFLMTSSILSSAVAQDTSFEIIYTNVIEDESQIKSNEGLEFNKIKEEVKEYKNENHTLILDTGNTLYNLTIANNGGLNAVAKMNEIGYVSLLLGNDYFNLEKNKIQELEKKADYEFLAANLKPQLISLYTIKEISGLKIGIFGIVNPNVVKQTHPDNIKGLSFENPYEVAFNLVDELKNKVDIIIALSYLGFDDNENYHNEYYPGWRIRQEFKSYKSHYYQWKVVCKSKFI